MDKTNRNLPNFEDIEYKIQILEILKISRQNLSNCIRDDLREVVVWLSLTRESAGALDTAISRLNKEIERDDKKMSKMQED